MQALGMRARQQCESAGLVCEFKGRQVLGPLIPTLADPAAAGSASIGRWSAAAGRALRSMARMSRGIESTSCESGRRSRHARSGHAGAPAV